MLLSIVVIASVHWRVFSNSPQQYRGPSTVLQRRSPGCISFFVQKMSQGAKAPTSPFSDAMSGIRHGPRKERNKMLDSNERILFLYSRVFLFTFFLF